MPVLCTLYWSKGDGATPMMGNVPNAIDELKLIPRNRENLGLPS